MEDEEPLRKTVGAMLSALGYECVATADGNQAMSAFIEASQSVHPFRAVILDLTVPGGMGGVETVQAIRRIDTKIPVFVSSGYAEDAAIADPSAYGFTDSLCKPFRTSELAALLDRNLAG
jgi:CheY-like chemotaxis protein